MTTEVSAIAPIDVHSTKSYSHATRFGNLLFISGQVAVGLEGSIVGNDVRAQTEQVWQNLKAVLRASGSDLRNVLKLTIYLTDRNHRAIFNEVRARHLADLGYYPASTVVIVAGLADPNWLIEVEAVAVTARAA